MSYQPECVPEADQSELFDLDQLILVPLIAEEQALEHRTAQAEHLLVAVQRLAVDEEANVAHLRTVEQRFGFILDAVGLRRI